MLSYVHSQPTIPTPSPSLWGRRSLMLLGTSLVLVAGSAGQGGVESETGWICPHPSVD